MQICRRLNNLGKCHIETARFILLFSLSSLLVLTGCGSSSGVNSAASDVAISNTAVLNDPVINGPSIDAGDYPSINAAVIAAEAANGTVIVSNAQTLASDLVVPSNVTFVMDSGGSIRNISNSKFSINGPFLAGLYMVFDGFKIGDVTFGNGSVERVLPQWWGAKGDGVADDSSAINSAIASLPAYGGEVSLATGNYLIVNTVEINKKVFFHGDGGYSSGGAAATTITKSVAAKGPGIYITADACVLERFMLTGESGNGGDGIVISGRDAGRVVLSELSVANQGRDGIRIGQDSPGGNQNGWRIDTVISIANGRNGVTIDDDNSSYLNPANANGGTSTNLQVISNKQDGLYVNMGGANSFEGTLAERNQRYGVHLGPAAHWEAFFGGDMNEGNTLADFILDSSYPGQGFNMIIGSDVGKLIDDGADTMIQAAVKNTISP
ncbi:MAG: glycosyl hydrolase family 28-related protein [Nitrospiraceae bacterium]|nr:glycosyl hydrolase family 28-related protein [Nitrospiraceae bacterium]